MNIFEHKYPTSNLHELDLTWIINKITDFEHRLDDFESDLHDRLLAETKSYVDEQMISVHEDFNNLRIEFAELQTEVTNRFNALEGDFATFTNAVNIQLNLMSRRIEAFEDEINQTVIGINALTDLKIEQNNEYILEKVAEGIINVKVLNYFTGEYVPVQSMFDTLAQLHLENPISYAQLDAAAITYTALAALNMTYTELAIKGKSFIDP